MIDPKAITIVFTTFNELDYLKLAIYSFLEFYPEYKSSIVVFDDCSSPCVGNWLNEEGIKRITWSRPSFVSDFSVFTKIYPGLSLSLRNGWMLRDIIAEHVRTKYALINDNDLLFLKPGFLEQYCELLEQGYKAIALYEEYNYGWAFCKQFPGEHARSVLGKYFSLYNPQNETMKRLHWCHGLLDVEFFKSQELLFDDITDKLLIQLSLAKGIIETGSDFFYNIEQRKIPYYKLDNVFNRFLADPRKIYLPLTDAMYDDYIAYHFRWRSSRSKLRNAESEPLRPPVPLNVLNANVIDRTQRDLSSCPKLAKRLSECSAKYGVNLYDK